MARNRIRALGLIARLADRRLEEDATRLTALRGRIAGLNAQKADLRFKAAHEGRVLSAEAAPYVACFLRSVRAEERRLDADLARLAQAAEMQERVVRASFAEARVMGHALKDATAARQAGLDRQDRIALDEAGLRRQPD